MHHLVPKLILGSFAAIVIIVLEQYLSKRRMQIARSEAGDDRPLPGPTAWADIKRGLLLLVMDFLVIGVMVYHYNLNEEEPVWEFAFAIITIGLIPIYALYHIGRGFYKNFTKS